MYSFTFRVVADLHRAGPKNTLFRVGYSVSIRDMHYTVSSLRKALPTF